MKNTPLSFSLSAIAIAAGLFITTGLASAQSVEVTTTASSGGTITEFTPGAFVVRSETATAPLRYTYSKTTTYVDEAGNPVSLETVKSGLPVEVYYTRVGRDLVASRVIVKKTIVAPAQTIVTPAPAPAVIEKKTTTTTTTTSEKK